MLGQISVVGDIDENVLPSKNKKIRGAYDSDRTGSNQPSQNTLLNTDQDVN